MSTVRDPDPIMAAWLDAGPREMPEATRRAIALAVASTSQRRRSAVRPGTGALSRFQLLGIAIVVSAVALIGMLAVAGSPDREPSVPPVTVTATPSPTSSTTDIPPMIESFTSRLHGYTVRYPAGWLAETATIPWAEFADATWIDAADDVSDRFINQDHSMDPRRVSIASVEIPVGLSEEEWIERNMPVRWERDGFQRPPAGEIGLIHCPGLGQWLRGAPVGQWESRSIAGRSGMVRASCGFVDGVAVVGRRAYVMTVEGFATWRAGPRTTAVFDAMVATLELHPEDGGDEPIASPPPSAPVSQTFTSKLYGYSLSYPADWIAKSATDPWTGLDWATKGSSADVMWPPVPSGEPRTVFFSVKAVDVPPGTTAATWAEANVARRPELEERADGHRHCRFGNNFVESGWSDEWHDASIGGQPARLRAACGFVDAVVVTGDRAYILSMFTRRDGGADTGSFDEIAATVVFERR